MHKKFELDSEEMLYHTFFYLQLEFTIYLKVQIIGNYFIFETEINKQLTHAVIEELFHFHSLSSNFQIDSVNVVLLLRSFCFPIRVHGNFCILN